MNTTRILRALWLNERISRIELARLLRLDKSTITMIVSSLIDTGIIKSVSEGKAGPQGGRKPIYLAINENFGSVIGLEMRPESCKINVTNLKGEIILSKTVQVKIHNKNITTVFHDILHETRNEIRTTAPPLLGVGVGIPGIINPHEGIIYGSNPLGIHEPINFNNKIVSTYDVPVCIENDANCCCWGELVFQKRPDLQNFIFILGEYRKGTTPISDYKGIEIGIGIVINGKVYYGSNYAAGEFQSIFWQHQNRNQFSMPDKEMEDIETNQQTFIKMAKELSRHIALLVNILNVNHLFLGGIFNTTHSSEILRILEEEIEENWSYAHQSDCEISFSSLEDQAVAYGAAGMLLEKIFTIPDITRKNNSSFLDVDLLTFLKQVGSNV